MKKVILFILSTVFILIVPNVVNAEAITNASNLNSVDSVGLSGNTVCTTGMTSIYTQSVGLAQGFKGLLMFDVFTFSGDTSQTRPIKQIQVATSNGKAYLCSIGTVSSIASSTSVSEVDYVYNVQCLVDFTSGYFKEIDIDYAFAGTDTCSSIGATGTFISYNSSSTAIINSQQQTTNAVNNVNDSINNDSVSSNTEHSNTAQGWASQSASDSVVSDMVLMPITLLNAFSSGFNGSCQAYNLGSLYGTNLTLPCINISNYLGATLWGIIDVLMSGFLIYGIGKKFVKVFNDFTNLKDSQVDELYGGGSE